MQSFLIVGGTKEGRLNKAQQMTNSRRIGNFDKIVLEEKNVKSIGIDQIRQLQHQLSLKPYASSYKMAVVTSAEKLTVQAQNAMLKLLEEPPRKTIIILSAQNPDLLLPTIVSRCQVVSLSLKPQVELDKEIFNSQFSILNSILKAGVGERIKIADEIAVNRKEAIKFCQAQLVIWRERMLKRSTVKLIREIQKTSTMLEANINPKLALENLLLHYPSPLSGRSGIVSNRTNR